MLGIELLWSNVSHAQADLFVENAEFTSPYEVAYADDRVAMLISNTSTSDAALGNDVWVRPVGRGSAVVDLGYPGYRLADVDGDGRSEVLSRGIDVLTGIDRGNGLMTFGTDFRYDFDGDGRNDLVTHVDAALSDGTRYVPIRVDWGPGVVFPAGDLDGDGRDDLVRLFYDLPWTQIDRVYEAHYELFLGADLRDDGWTSRWSFRPETHPAMPGTAFLDTDGDGAVELVALYEHETLDTIELAVFGDLLTPTGPRELARGTSKQNGSWNGMEDPARLLPVGDWDGDDDVLAHTTAIAGSATLALLDADLDEPLRIVDTFDLREGSEPAYGDRPGLDNEFVGDFDGDGDLDVALSRPYGVGFYGVDPTLLEEDPPRAPGALLGGCGAGGGTAMLGVVGIGLLGLRRRLP
jgi:hypothetical protein